MTKARQRVLGRPASAALEGHRINEGRIDEPRPASAIAWVNFPRSRAWWSPSAGVLPLPVSALGRFTPLTG
jgi:hypothetical protein